MGMFDTIKIGDNEFQTKAFGKNLQTYSIGDQISIIPSPRSLAEFNYPEEPVNLLGKKAQVDIIDVKTNEDKFLLIDDNTIKDVSDQEFDNALKFDYYGHCK